MRADGSNPPAHLLTSRHRRDKLPPMTDEIRLPNGARLSLKSAEEPRKTKKIADAPPARADAAKPTPAQIAEMTDEELERHSAHSWAFHEIINRKYEGTRKPAGKGVRAE